MLETADIERHVYRKDFIPAFAARTGLDEKKAEEVLDTFQQMLVEYWSDKTTVCLTGFGIFRIRETSERMARNPKTMEDHLIPAGYKPEFKASRGLRETVDKNIKKNMLRG